MGHSMCCLFGSSTFEAATAVRRLREETSTRRVKSAHMLEFRQHDERKTLSNSDGDMGSMRRDHGEVAISRGPSGPNGWHGSGCGRQQHRSIRQASRTSSLTIWRFSEETGEPRGRGMAEAGTSTDWGRANYGGDSWCCGPWTRLPNDGRKRGSLWEQWHLAGSAEQNWKNVDSEAMTRRKRSAMPKVLKTGHGESGRQGLNRVNKRTALVPFRNAAYVPYRTGQPPDPTGHHELARWRTKLQLQAGSSADAGPGRAASATGAAPGHVVGVGRAVRECVPEGLGLSLLPPPALRSDWLHHPRHVHPRRPLQGHGKRNLNTTNQHHHHHHCANTMSSFRSASPSVRLHRAPSHPGLARVCVRLAARLGRRHGS
ncbi:hypothetical protein IWX90DRAFT_96525 [Phyllosticta citrichinensis]|uniref:Uncharacterized protein n=1 Tax=Phyllosticta citrichinensis TaxID=1130410 RepID=A0ABR1XER4_9PEZI